MELKYGQNNVLSWGGVGSNRTFMELKLLSACCAICSGVSSNRTFMELK